MAVLTVSANTCVPSDELIVNQGVGCMREIERFLAAVEVLREKASRELPSQQLVLFLTVVQEPGITMQELSRRLAMPQGSVSRNVRALAGSGEGGNGSTVRKGHGLLRTEPDPTSRQGLSVYLTVKGRTVVEQMVEMLNPESQLSQRTLAAAARRVSLNGRVGA
jgi:DNA-binding MarR family transcriptional regulator